MQKSDRTRERIERRMMIDPSCDDSNEWLQLLTLGHRLTRCEKSPQHCTHHRRQECILARTDQIRYLRRAATHPSIDIRWRKSCRCAVHAIGTASDSRHYILHLRQGRSRVRPQNPAAAIRKEREKNIDELLFQIVLQLFIFTPSHSRLIE